jgi:hypothetical protein
MIVDATAVSLDGNDGEIPIVARSAILHRVAGAGAGDDRPQCLPLADPADD